VPHVKAGPTAADRRGVVLGWLTRLAVFAAVLGVIGFDGISLTAGHLGAHEDASNAAGDAAVAWRSADGTQYPAQALAAATTAADDRLTLGEALVPGSIQVAADGTLTLTIRRTVEHTLIAHDIGALKHLVTFDATGSGTPTNA
jgi:hypothetical protein